MNYVCAVNLVRREDLQQREMASTNGKNGHNGKSTDSCVFFDLIPLPDQYCTATLQRPVIPMCDCCH